MPLRYEVDQHDDLLKRYRNPVFPVLSIVDPEGSVVATPEIPRRDLPVQQTDSPEVPRTVQAIEAAVAIGKRADKDFHAFLATADLTKPEVREDLVKRHVNRSDPDLAVEAYRGFGEKDTSDERYRSLVRLGECLTEMGRHLDADSLLAQGESVFPQADQRTKIIQLRLKTYVERFKKAYVAKDRRLCQEVVEEIQTRFPWSDYPAKLMKFVEKLPPE